MKEVIQKIIAHQAEGVVFHDMMTDYFDFLGLDGFMNTKPLKKRANIEK